MQLVAAGAGADLQHDVAIIHRILGQKRDADLLRQIDAACLKRLPLGLRHGAHLGLDGRIGDQRIDAGDFRIGAAVGFHGLDQRIELGKLPGDPDVFLGVHLAQQLGLKRSVVREQNV